MRTTLKRPISLLLMLCMLMSLVSGMTFTVSAASAANISIASAPNKVEYQATDILNLNGLTVSLTDSTGQRTISYARFASEGISTTLMSGNIPCASLTAPLTTANTGVMISYGGDYVIQPITVKTKVITPTVDPLIAQAYYGSQIKPDPVVKDGRTVLVKDVDYTVKYSANNVPGTNTGSITVQAKGNYSFTPVTRYFDIVGMIAGTQQLDLTVPAKYISPNSAIPANQNCTARTTWRAQDSVADLTDNFRPGTVYIATVVLSANANWKFTSNMKVFVDGASDTSTVVAADGKTAVVTATYPRTASNYIVCNEDKVCCRR